MRSRTPIFAALLVVSAIALYAHFRIFAFVTDDAFISFVYSRNLVEHGQLVFNLGERVEGYTNFLWTVFLAGWMKLGWQPESSSLVWGYLFALGSMIGCGFFCRRMRDDGAAGWSAWDALPALLLAAVPGWACWAGGGLETQMFVFFTTIGSALYLAPSDGGRLRRSAAICFALAALTRPEGNLFFAFACLHRGAEMLRNRRILPRSDELAFVAIYCALVVPHFLWRHHYYGYWVPNTFYIKSSGGAGTWARGAHYLWRYVDTFWLHAMGAIAIAGLAAGWRSPGLRRHMGWTLFVVPVFFLYVASVGGDFMGLYRFALPTLPPIAIACALGLRALCARAPRPALVAPALCAALLAIYAWHDVAVDRAAMVYLGPGASDSGIDTPGYLRWYTEDRAAIGRWFGRYRQPDDFAAVGGAGAQVYYSRMPSLDCFGLSDAYIAHQVPAVSNRPGHEKYAPNDYILSRRPTIITSNRYWIGSAINVQDDEPYWRAHGFHYVAAEVPGLSSPVYTFLKRLDRAVGPLPAVSADLQ